MKTAWGSLDPWLGADISEDSIFTDSEFEKLKVQG